jgi:AcrR family transcriptional regulator
MVGRGRLASGLDGRQAKPANPPRLGFNSDDAVPRAAALPAAERRSLAVQALLELAAETAPDQISTAAIALRMGTSHAALFRHFPSRDALWAESVRWATGQLDQRFTALATDLATTGGADPLQEVEQLLEQVDQKHSGEIDWEEWAAAMADWRSVSAGRAAAGAWGPRANTQRQGHWHA